ncbi:MAG: carbohydrate ABC transporter permease [Thermomicrobiales bacterium]
MDDGKRRKKSRSTIDTVLLVGSYIVLALVVIFTAYPLLWMVFGSFKSMSAFYTNIWGPPKTIVWENYRDAWRVGGIGRYFVNSVIVTTLTLLLVLTFSSLAAYSFAKMRFPGRDVLFYFLLASMMMPTGIIAIPIFEVVYKLGILNTRASMVLVYSASGMAFGTFILRAFFLAIPRELEEAALLDGATPFRAFWQIILPLSKPALATLMIFTGMGTWNEYFLGSILVRSADLRTLPLGLVAFVSEHSTNYPQYFAALTIITIPIIVLYIACQRQFLSGLTAGAVKG